ncbi:phosphatidylserine decarboxylase [Piscirickettsia salmonis]|uniref:Phosphatidylserine decarboxylase proenzyme n=1 Tax=Piscirickettsia salmonis TaxID=1238 RepID=A0A9Q6PSN9_PISSA|nr:archaetidylserine decarboxylase [Piscirickettsia salmonis]ALA25226.1 phosphatidylserine decarboxylase [Piscirickettsia salmonis]APS45484.1 phosphatidylserine decarboxylase [Piscirickettsia salmonis]APS48845.1 phosphatidylserine decarboxylase [Piscirickettsia salmonis]APS50079.1 phosphatidylserine decarboxylase [Piscirickettsia salmonis]APS53279.1 phosphatidylserine decarboxylase [Piscirickettsia salmonis]
MKNRIQLFLQRYIVPQHLYSRFLGFLAERRIPLVTHYGLRDFVKRYGVDMSEAIEENPDHYRTFNQFFTRAIKPELRPITQDKHIVTSPVDGTISQIGNIHQEQLIQAKGFQFSAASLLGSVEDARAFTDGLFTTLYLAPRDYHRVHMPCAGRLTHMRYIPGELFSVNPYTASHIDGLFARNERVVCFFETEQGPMAMVLVGAIIVASIETVWAGTIAPGTPREVRTWHYRHNKNSHIYLDKGEEMGRFKLGSTVILMMGKGVAQWQQQLTSGHSVRMGMPIGEYHENLVLSAAKEPAASEANVEVE